MLGLQWGSGRRSRRVRTQSTDVDSTLQPDGQRRQPQALLRAGWDAAGCRADIRRGRASTRSAQPPCGARRGALAGPHVG